MISSLKFVGHLAAWMIISMAVVVVMVMILTGCTTVHQVAPPAPVHQPVQVANEPTVIVPPAAQETAPVVAPVAPTPHRAIHHAKRATAIVAAAAPAPAFGPDLAPAVIAVPIATLKPPLPDWSVQAIGGSVLVWCLVLVGWMWRKRRKPTMADGMDKMVNQMRRDFQKARRQL